MIKINLYSHKLTRYLALFLLGILAISIATALIISEQEEKLQQITSENKLLEQQLPLLSGRNDTMTGSGAMWKYLLPNEAEPVVWENQILMLALASGIVINEINVIDPIPLEQHKVYIMKVNFSGDFFKILAFFESIDEEIPLYIVNIEKMYSKDGQIHGIVVIKNNVF